MKYCIKCMKDKAKELFGMCNKAKDKLQSYCKECKADYGKDNVERLSKYHKKWRHNNKEHLKIRYKRYYNSHKEQMKAASKRWNSKNPSNSVVTASKRRAAKLNSTPTWVDQELIDLIYTLAQDGVEEIGIAYHVDHVVPLQGEYVCGLHVHNNLQLLTPVDNMCKSNHHDVNEFQTNSYRRWHLHQEEL